MVNKIDLYGFEFDDYNFPFDDSKHKCDEIIGFFKNNIKEKRTSSQIEFYIGEKIFCSIIMIEPFTEDDIQKSKQAFIDSLSTRVYFKNIIEIFLGLLPKQGVSQYMHIVNSKNQIRFMDSKLFRKGFIIILEKFENDCLYFTLSNKEYKIELQKIKDKAIDVHKFIDNVIYENIGIYYLP